MAAIRKALITLFGGRGSVPKPDQLDECATKIFDAVCDAVQDDEGRTKE